MKELLQSYNQPDYPTSGDDGGYTDNGDSAT